MSNIVETEQERTALLKLIDAASRSLGAQDASIVAYFWRKTTELKLQEGNQEKEDG